MYVMQSRDGFYVHLYSMTAAEFRQTKTQNEHADTDYHRIDGTEAYRWVRADRIHSTPLYIDDGRIRFARDGY